MSQESYDAVGQAAAALRAAQRAYLDARYENYRQRFVSPAQAYKVAVEDLAEVTTHGLEHAQNGFIYEHARELRTWLL